VSCQFPLIGRATWQEGGYVIRSTVEWGLKKSRPTLQIHDKADLSIDFNEMDQEVVFVTVE
jgi:hypothetical protein